MPKAPNIFIRPFRKADTRAVVAAFRTNIPEFFHPSEVPWFRRYLTQKGNPNFVILLHSRIVGFGGYAIDRYANRAHLCWGFIHRDFHRQGLGRALLNHRISHLAARKPITRFLALNTTPDSAGFFKRSGFKTYGTWPGGFRSGLTMVEMMLDLHQPGRKWVSRHSAAMPR